MSITFTKLFSSITASTVWCTDPETKVVWITLLAMADKNGRIWGSVPGIAGIARVPVESCRRALDRFLGPDLDSRTKEHEGRRIEAIDGGWKLLNYAKYRALRDEEERKEYKREWVANKRSVDKPVDNVDKSRPQYTYAEAEAEAEADKKRVRVRFAPPAIEEIKIYMEEKGKPEEAEKFHNFYSANGWKVGRNKMTSWKHAASGWISRTENFGVKNKSNKFDWSIENDSPEF